MEAMTYWAAFWHGQVLTEDEQAKAYAHGIEAEQEARVQGHSLIPPEIYPPCIGLSHIPTSLIVAVGLVHQALKLEVAA